MESLKVNIVKKRKKLITCSYFFSKSVSVSFLTAIVSYNRSKSIKSFLDVCKDLKICPWTNRKLDPECLMDVLRELVKCEVYLEF